MAELYACINDWGAEQHCGVPLWDRVRPPAAPKVNGNATPEPKANGKTTAAPIERQATPKPKANGKAAAMPTAQPTPPERQGQAKAEPSEKTPREILWTRQVNRAHLSLAARVLTTYIAHLWGVKGCAYFKQNTVADEMGISIPTFKRAVRELVEGGHVKVRKGRGRGNASEYTPVLKKPYLAGILPPRVDDDEHTKQKVSPQPPFTDKKGSNETVKGVTRSPTTFL